MQFPLSWNKATKKEPSTVSLTDFQTLQNGYDALKSAHERLNTDLGQHLTAIEEDRREKSSTIEHLTSQRNGYAGQLATIRASLREVSVFEGLDVGDYLTKCVSELVADHEELEARIDAALMTIKMEQDAKRSNPIYSEIADLLKGGKRIPDTIDQAD